MAKVKLFFIIAFSIWTVNIHSKERNAIYINILPLLVNHLNIHYERAISQKISVVAGVGYTSGIFGVSPGEDWSIYTLLYKLGVGFYPAGVPLRGIYFQPSLIPARFTAEYRPTKNLQQLIGLQ